MNGFDCERNPLGPQHRPSSILWLAGQMFFIPLRTFLYGMGMMIEAMRGMQVIGDRGMEVMAGGVVAEPAVPPPATGHISETVNPINEAVKGGIEETKQMDQDLNDDMLKLVRYKILFVKRDYEFAFPEHEELVSDNMDGQAYTAWKIAEFIQKLEKGRREPDAEKFRIPEKWEEYPKAEHRYEHSGARYLAGIDEDDKKYLRVFYEVLERYPREKFKFEEDQIKVLKEIRDRIDKKSTGGKSDAAQKGMNVG